MIAIGGTGYAVSVRRYRILSLVLALALGYAATSVGMATAAGAQGRHVVVVGDSILLGAQNQLAAQYARIGWTATLDMAVSRSTLAGLDAIERHRGELGDSLVIGLGANDAGDTAAFKSRVERVLNAISEVPHVYWLTIAEVRPYYPAANQVLRDAASTHPNLTVIEWAQHAAATPTATGSDGLHLTSFGATEMANLVSFATVIGATPKPVGGAAPSIAPAPADATPKSTRLSPSVPTTGPAPDAVTPDGADPKSPNSTSPNTTSPNTTEVSTTTTTIGAMEWPPSDRDSEATGSGIGARPDGMEGSDGGGWFPISVLGQRIGAGPSLLIAALALFGVAVGTWTVTSRRRDAYSGDDDRDDDVDVI
ncbi:MAG: hypothetical protein WBA45_11790 [Microthrixaceae bacterium]